VQTAHFQSLSKSDVSLNGMTVMLGSYLSSASTSVFILCHFSLRYYSYLHSFFLFHLFLLLISLRLMSHAAVFLALVDLRGWKEGATSD
jgi:hypothetical protein